MDVRTYRAATMHEALTLVRRDLGPDAAVLHTRETRSRRFFGCLPGRRQIEVTASSEVNVPSKLPQPSVAEQSLVPIEPPPEILPQAPPPGPRVPAPSDRKSTRLNSSHIPLSRMPSSA